MLEKKRGAELKIVPIDELAGIVQKHKGKGKIVVQCHGVFDLLHPGHIRHLKTAKNMGDILIISLTKDRYVNKGPGRPAFNETLRAETLASLSDVDYVTISQTPSAVEAILKLKPNLYVKGEEYQDSRADITGGIAKEEQAVLSVGGKIAFTHEITFSSSRLLNNYFDVYPSKTKAFLQQFRQRYNADQIIGMLERLKNLKVLVLGETIIDEYHYCKPMGKSPKESIVSTRYLSEERFPGGTLAAANHIAGFAGHVELITCVGSDGAYKDLINTQLNKNIKAHLVATERPTIIKRRFVDPAFLTKLFEISYLEEKPLAPPVEAELWSHIEPALKRCDVVVVTDYGHGMISAGLVQKLCAVAPYLAVNTQTNSANLGFNPITKYPKADFVCIDEPEIRLAMRLKFEPIEEVMLALQKQIAVKNFIVTRGHEGAIVYDQTSGFFPIPVFSEKIVDRVGAGDAYFSVASLCAAAKLPMDLTGFIGNAAGAIAVTIVCNREPIAAVPLYKFIATLLK